MLFRSKFEGDLSHGCLQCFISFVVSIKASSTIVLSSSLSLEKSPSDGIGSGFFPGTLNGNGKCTNKFALRWGALLGPPFAVEDKLE